ncbi:unnamed protein product [Closterium sp. Naga37s-1]|nr:unnamed protein product [Closterium sp. Naga37s-1]
MGGENEDVAERGANSSSAVSNQVLTAAAASGYATGSAGKSVSGGGRGCGGGGGGGGIGDGREDGAGEGSGKWDGGREEGRGALADVALAGHPDDPLSWSVESVGEWLQREGFGEYRGVFATQQVNGAVLLRLSRESLAELVPSLGPRMAVLDAIEKLRGWKAGPRHVGEGLVSGLHAFAAKFVHGLDHLLVGAVRCSAVCVLQHDKEPYAAAHIEQHTCSSTHAAAHMQQHTCSSAHAAAHMHVVPCHEDPVGLLSHPTALHLDPAFGSSSSVSPSQALSRYKPSSSPGSATTKLGSGMAVGDERGAGEEKGEGGGRGGSPGGGGSGGVGGNGGNGWGGGGEGSERPALTGGESGGGGGGGGVNSNSGAGGMVVTSAPMMVRRIEEAKPDFLKDEGDGSRPAHIGEGILVGMRCFGSDLYDGITGIVTEPMKAMAMARDKGSGSPAVPAAAVMRGLAKGLAGAICKPVAGGFELAHATVEGIIATPQTLAAAARDGPAIQDTPTYQRLAALRLLPGHAHVPAPCCSAPAASALLLCACCQVRSCSLCVRLLPWPVNRLKSHQVTPTYQRLAALRLLPGVSLPSCVLCVSAELILAHFPESFVRPAHTPPPCCHAPAAGCVSSTLLCCSAFCTCRSVLRFAQDLSLNHDLPILPAPFFSSPSSTIIGGHLVHGAGSTARQHEPCCCAFSRTLLELDPLFFLLSPLPPLPSSSLPPAQSSEAISRMGQAAQHSSMSPAAAALQMSELSHRGEMGAGTGGV